MISSSIGGGGLGVRGPFFLLWLPFEVLKVYKTIVRSLNISGTPPGYFKVFLKKQQPSFQLLVLLLHYILIANMQGENEKEQRTYLLFFSKQCLLVMSFQRVVSKRS